MRGLDSGLLPDLWNFPGVFGRSPEEARERLREKLHRLIPTPFSLGEPLAEFRHTITFRTIRGKIYPVETPGGFRRGDLHWFELARLPQAAISQLARKILLHIT
jgi:hypothetical protein